MKSVARSSGSCRRSWTVRATISSPSFGSVLQPVSTLSIHKMSTGKPCRRAGPETTATKTCSMSGSDGLHPAHHTDEVEGNRNPHARCQLSFSMLGNLRYSLPSRSTSAARASVLTVCRRVVRPGCVMATGILCSDKPRCSDTPPRRRDIPSQKAMPRQIVTTRSSSERSGRSSGSRRFSDDLPDAAR